MRPSIRARTLSPFALLVPLVCAGCYDPPVSNTVMIAFERDGRVSVVVETTFKSADGLKPAEREEIERVLDLYDLGRDPWLRGFERAAAVDVTHERTGGPGTPRGIIRKGDLPSIEAIVQLMPDAIANFRLLHDSVRGTETLRITHIDMPESLRENRHRIEREVEAFAHVGYRFSQAHCDLYDYLSVHAERRHDVLQALEDQEHIRGLLTPGETVLIRRLAAALEELTGFEERKTPPIMARMSFAPFEHGFCVRLPPGAEMVDAGGFVAVENDQKKPTWCAPRLTLPDLLDDAFPRAEPHLLDASIREDETRLAAEPFSCIRHTDEGEIAAAIRERIFPAARYEIVWRAGEPAR